MYHVPASKMRTTTRGAREAVDDVRAPVDDARRVFETAGKVIVNALSLKRTRSMRIKRDMKEMGERTMLYRIERSRGENSVSGSSMAERSSSMGLNEWAANAIRTSLYKRPRVRTRGNRESACCEVHEGGWATLCTTQA